MDMVFGLRVRVIHPLSTLMLRLWFLSTPSVLALRWLIKHHHCAQAKGNMYSINYNLCCIWLVSQYDKFNSLLHTHTHSSLHTKIHTKLTTNQEKNKLHSKGFKDCCVVLQTCQFYTTKAPEITVGQVTAGEWTLRMVMGAAVSFYSLFWSVTSLTPPTHTLLTALSEKEKAKACRLAITTQQHY